MTTLYPFTFMRSLAAGRDTRPAGARSLASVLRSLRSLRPPRLRRRVASALVRVRGELRAQARGAVADVGRGLFVVDRAQHGTDHGRDLSHLVGTHARGTHR